MAKDFCFTCDWKRKPFCPGSWSKNCEKCIGALPLSPELRALYTGKSYTHAVKDYISKLPAGQFQTSELVSFAIEAGLHFDIKAAQSTMGVVLQHLKKTGHVRHVQQGTWERI